MSSPRLPFFQAQEVFFAEPVLRELLLLICRVLDQAAVLIAAFRSCGKIYSVVGRRFRFTGYDRQG